MKTLKTRPKFLVIGVRGLILIYLLLILLTILFSRSFISGLLETGEIPGLAILAVFFVIPAVLLVLLLGSGFTMARDVFARAPGSRFQLRLLVYFFIIVALAAAPVTLISSLSISELLRFWRTINVDRAMNEAQRFAMKNYSMNLENLEKTADLDFTEYAREHGSLPPNIAAVEDFVLRNGAWVSAGLLGDAGHAQKTPPLEQRGFVPRELPRDIDVVRYVTRPEQNRIRVVTLALGGGFDSALTAIETEKARFNVISSIRFNIRRLLIFYYGVFFLPALLMTIIIAISFTRKVAYPIEELTEATRRVAEGDFSVRVLPRKGDELAALAESFNMMVGDLEKSQAALLKTEKISVWQDMAQRLAHEIKNPLTPIRLSAERILRRWQNNPEKIGEILENSMLAIIQEVEGLSTLLNDFRDLSRPTEITGARTDIGELTAEVIQMYSASHPKIIFDTKYLAAGISLGIEKRRFARILSNLILNAIDAMDGEGLIEIRADLVKKGESGYCRLTIRDNGRGISKEDARRIFSPYFTTKESGTGLGLPIVERIVNDHGGAIRFDSAEGAGTTFYIDLPLEKEHDGRRNTHN